MSNIVLEAKSVPRAYPILRHVVPLKDENCCLTMPVFEGHCAELRDTFDIGVFKCGKTVLQ